MRQFDLVATCLTSVPSGYDVPMTTQINDNEVIINTRSCMHCGQTGELVVRYESVEMRQSGMSVQEAFWYLAAPQREQIISGTHPHCWEQMFGQDCDDDDDDDDDE